MMEMMAPRRRADLLELLGELRGSGYQQPRYLVIRGDGQAVHLTRLLYLVLEALDGTRTDAQVAALISEQVGKHLPVPAVEFLADTKLAPLGLLSAAASAQDSTDGHCSATDVDDRPAPGAQDSTDGGRPATDADDRPAPTARPLLALRLHATLLPARWVPAAARPLTPLFHPPVIVALLAALATVDGYLIARRADVGGALAASITAPAQILAVLAAMVAVSLFHEFGHAAGCVAAGGRPGRIGIGLYVMFPAFFTDVNDSYRLDRRGRLSTDLGGVYFSAVAATVVAGTYLAGGPRWLLLVAFLAQLELIQQLLPLVRMDGYFILADLTGVPDLFGRVRPILLGLLPGREAHPDVAQLLPRTRTVVTVWVAVVVPVLAAGLGYLAWQLPTMAGATVRTIGSAWDRAGIGWAAGSFPAVTLALLTGLLSTLPLVGLALLAAAVMRRLGAAAVRVARRAQSGVAPPGGSTACRARSNGADLR